jgi:3-phosphoshikimate 1-carboxyvinyltransferase
MKVAGTLRVPGDKSMHRALILSALAKGESRVTGILESADVHSTAGVLRALGAKIPELSPDFVIVGRGVGSLATPVSLLDCGNSGTTTRLMAGVVAGRPIEATFIGDASLSRRPMRRVTDPLAMCGARFAGREGGRLPIAVQGATARRDPWQSEVPARRSRPILLAALACAELAPEIIRPQATRDHTERMLIARAGVGCHSRDGRADRRARLRGTARCDGAGRSLLGGLLRWIGGDLRRWLAPSRERGASTKRASDSSSSSSSLRRSRDAGGCAPRGWRGLLRTSSSRPASFGTGTITRADVPAMVDELPLLACLATRAAGETTITGANELRVKESDRIAAVVANLRAIGADAEELPDGMKIRGPSPALSGRITTHGDHRLAMAFGILGAAAGNSIEIDDRDCVTVSYPNFWNDLASVTR